MIQKRLFEQVAAAKLRIRESFSGEITAERVDRDACVIRDCAILGSDSENDRVYEPTALNRAMILYEGCSVRIDHKPGETRSVTEDVGVLKHVRLVNGKVRGDFHFLKTHPQAAYFCERAERFPETFGFSHEADGMVEVDGNGRERVIDLLSVESVDLVRTPATNKSLFEERKTMAKVKKNIRDVVRAAPVKTPGRKRMLEMIGDPAMDGQIEVSEDESPEQQLEVALKASLQAIMNDPEKDNDAKIAAIAALVGDPVVEAENDPQKVEPAKEEPEPKKVEEEGDDPKPKQEGEVLTEAIQKIRKEFGDKYDQQNKLIKTLTEQNDQYAKAAKAEAEVKAVRKLFEQSGVASPTDAQIEIAVRLVGKHRTEYVDTIKTLVEQSEVGGSSRSSGASSGESIGSYDSILAEFPKTK
ncbi:hypothetical protein SH668x_001259 [Planctomicrobium sp. SH668]|uniref:hypothetical protein n=1 Tax=Planctomicrobium sp. SH668 TaxID=3448126 RepID=UPI003F5C8255